VLLSDGPSNSAWYEHLTLARRLGIPLVTPGDLYTSGGALHAFVAEGSVEVHVVYRRTDEDRLRDEHGRATWIADLLLDHCRRGRVACVNAFGTGVADDKLLHAYADDMVRFYLGESPLIESVRTYDLGDPDCRDEALARVEELVVKPRAGHGGHGIVVGPHASAEDRALIARRVSARPTDWIAQETVQLSRHPTVDEGRLVPRHVDLRAFVVAGDDSVSVAPGGLTRFARAEGSLVVNSSQGGGGKDTWVLR
jgi:carboxylate-amine ligase